MASLYKRSKKGAWYIGYTGHDGKRKTVCAKTTDKALAKQLAAKLERDVIQVRSGVLPPEALEASRKNLEGHLDDYLASIRMGNSVKYILGIKRKVLAAADHGKWTKVRDITEASLNSFLKSLEAKGRSARTIGSHVGSIRGFVLWLVDNDRLSKDPTRKVKRPSVAEDRRLERRALLPDEWTWLEQSTEDGPERLGMSGHERALLYRTAVETGLRSGELRSLTRGNLHLDEPQPYVTCKASSTKNSKEARQYVQGPLALRLTAFAATKHPNATLFSLPCETRLASVIRADLKEARKAWLREAIGDAEEYQRRDDSDFLLAVNHEGHRIDFHALRHTCGFWLTVAGVYPKVVQQVMRHSDIKLTLDTYGHLMPDAVPDAINLMPCSAVAG